MQPSMFLAASSVNPITVHVVAGTSKIALSFNPNRLAIIFPAPPGADAYKLSYNNLFTATSQIIMTSSQPTFIISRRDIGSAICQRLYILSSFTGSVEITEIIAENGAFGNDGDPLPLVY